MSNVVQKLEDFVNLSDPDKNQIFNMTLQEAEERVSSGKPEEIRKIDGNFAIVTKRGKQVYMARSIGRPLRYFMAKQVAGPLLIVADRIDEIYQYLKTLGLHHQFRPDYTRMVPAHYVTRLDVVGCPDPNPEHKRFFTPEMNRLEPDLDKIGEAYVSAMADECSKWLDSIPKEEPIGVLFSGGIDSGSVFLVLYDLLLRRGESP
ncbi:MAG TPA: hypothetical protein VK040_04630, partial [Balneolaceae bacterium]|nr:hypothetical protein [Balneolaceae bacterium]